MKGIRKKISVGFLSLGLLLFFSGLISYFELSRLSKNTQHLINSSAKNIEHAKKMLDAVQEQNTALLQIIVTGNKQYDSLLIAGRNQFSKVISEATVSINDLKSLDEIYKANARYNLVVNSHLNSLPDKENIAWFMNIYSTSYYDLTTAIKNYMIASHNVVSKKTTQLESNAYRAIMPSIIALAIAIIIILVFSYLIDIYFVQPVLKISKGLKNFINAKIPFNVKMEGRDEVYELKESVETLIAEYKNKRSES